ncbi:Sodium-coupled monocarboxylate transporter 1 [Tupaia chinensis]|uniref:Sodium-coupled monocarboxylate transporter 1 n=1 Tax=Tupaia chinensis TaxID=246437 RepID=L9L9E3_TUPCH|nr:Sodium-coupled monocarboxylate transporter 1 [Tupaia chinensis]
MDRPRAIGTFVVWDYVVFAGMLLISAAIGIYYAFAGGGQQTSKEFLTGGRRMSAVPVALSLSASFMSAVTVLGTPSEVYRFGAIFTMFAFTYFFVVVISAEVFLPVFYKLGITSTYEYLELRFNRHVRLCGTVLFIVQTILYTGIVIYAPALALNQVTGFDLWGAVVATGVVCTFYCTLLMPYLVLDILRDYPGLPGLFVACAYSGTLSTVSSSINALAAVTVEDLIKPHFRSLSERSLSWTSQGLSVLYGALCIGMAALASLMGALLQAALSIFGMVGGPLLGLFALGILVPTANSIGALVGLMAGFVVSLWVGIGAQLYPPLPERTMPLPLETHGCNSTYNATDLMTTTEMPFSTSAFQIHNVERTPLMDNWYSLSYLYFSTLGTLVALLVGTLISLLTGGRKQNIEPRFLLTKEDFLSNFDIFKKEKNNLSYKSHPVEDGGTDNPAFNHIELNLTDHSGKINGTRL